MATMLSMFIIFYFMEFLTEVSKMRNFYGDKQVGHLVNHLLGHVVVYIFIMFLSFPGK